MIREILKKLVIFTVVLSIAAGVSARFGEVSVRAEEKLCNAQMLSDYLIGKLKLDIPIGTKFGYTITDFEKAGMIFPKTLTTWYDAVTVEDLASVCTSLLSVIGEDKDDDEEMDYNIERLFKTKRIYDIYRASEEQKRDLARVFLKGIIIGKSMGKYTQDRKVEPKRKITYSELKKAVNKVYDVSKRAPMTPDGQLLRTKNLPVNASEYKHILASFPNSFYESRFYYEKYPATYQPADDVEGYYKPNTVERIVKKGYWGDTDIHILASRMTEYQNHRMNVNYLTIDNRWADKLISFYLTEKSDDRQVKGITEEIYDYVKFIKENRIIIQAEYMAAEGSAAFYCHDALMFHQYMKYKVVSCDNLEKNKYKLIFGSYINDSPWGISRNFKGKMKLGEWIEGVFGVAYQEMEKNSGSTVHFPWAWINETVIDNPARYIKKTKILKQYLITKGDKYWPDTDLRYELNGWK